MTTTPLPLTAPPHGTVRPPKPRPTEDHRTHLSGGARYASGPQTQEARPAGRSLSHGRRGPSGEHR